MMNKSKCTIINCNFETGEIIAGEYNTEEELNVAKVTIENGNVPEGCKVIKNNIEIKKFLE